MQKANKYCVIGGGQRRFAEISASKLRIFTRCAETQNPGQEYEFMSGK
jgi:hypothetical protein